MFPSIGCSTSPDTLLPHLKVMAEPLRADKRNMYCTAVQTNGLY